MELNKVEKITFAFLFALLIFGLMLLIVRFSSSNRINNIILKKINTISSSTDRTPLEKTLYFDEKDSINKLNINRTNFASLKEVPCLNDNLAKRIITYISEKGQISDLKELLEVKGMNLKKVKELDKYVTVLGGHAGSAAWGNKLNLNFANINDLAKLDGLNKKLAEKIINFRNSNGSFHSIDELYEIPGLSDKTIKKFIDKVEIK